MADADRHEPIDPTATLTDQELIDQNPELCSWLEPLLEHAGDQDLELQIRALDNAHAEKLKVLERLTVEHDSEYAQHNQDWAAGNADSMNIASS